MGSPVTEKMPGISLVHRPLMYFGWPLVPVLRQKGLYLNTSVSRAEVSKTEFSRSKSDMAVIKKGLVIRKVKHIGISGAFIMALGGAGVLFTGCNKGGNQEEEYSYEEVSYTKGVISHIKEVKPGEFQITDEESVPASDAKAIVSYLDGHTDTLSVETSKALIDKEIANSGTQYHSSGLSSMLLYGGMGYMLGSMMGNNRIAQQRAAYPNNAGFYGSPAAYNKAQAAQQDVSASRSVRTVKSRPTNSRSGFMGARGSRSSGG